MPEFMYSMFGGAYSDACMPSWSHRHDTPLPRIASLGLCRNKGGMLRGRQSFCPNFSSATGVCGWCDYTLPQFRILGFAGILAASGCFRVRPAWIVFFLFCCWVANGKHKGGSKVLHWVLSLLSYLYLMVHCQRDKSGQKFIYCVIS